MAAIGCAIVVLGADALQSVNAAGHSVAPFLIALPLALLPVPLLVGCVLLVDRLEPEPRVNLVLAFAWGAGVAALLAAVINTAGLIFITQPALGNSTGEYVSATFGAPVVEESLKGLILIILLWRRRQELDGPTDGIIYAAMVGLGFAMMENIGYYIGALVRPEVGGAELLGATFVLRGVLSPLAHPIFTSMTGLGRGVRGHPPGRPLGGAARAGRRHAAARAVERAERARPDGLALAYAILACVLAVPGRRDHRRPAPDRPADLAVPACLRGHRPGHRGGPADAEHAARAARGAALGPADRRAGRLPGPWRTTSWPRPSWPWCICACSAASSAPEHFDERRRDLLRLMAMARSAFFRRQPEPPQPPWAGRGSSGFGRHRFS